MMKDVCAIIIVGGPGNELRCLKWLATNGAFVVVILVRAAAAAATTSLHVRRVVIVVPVRTAVRVVDDICLGRHDGRPTKNAPQHRVAHGIVRYHALGHEPRFQDPIPLLQARGSGCAELPTTTTTLVQDQRPHDHESERHDRSHQKQKARDPSHVVAVVVAGSVGGVRVATAAFAAAAAAARRQSEGMAGIDTTHTPNRFIVE
jgi:hypothetical protein